MNFIVNIVVVLIVGLLVNVIPVSSYPNSILKINKIPTNIKNHEHEFINHQPYHLPWGYIHSHNNINSINMNSLGGVMEPPQSFDWRNVNGTSWVTHNRNQVQPKFCGSCWAQAPTSTLMDRFKIARNNSGTEITISVQYILNCASGKAFQGTCPVPYGNHHLVNKYINEEGVPDETCMAYMGESNGCAPVNQCRDCFTDPPFKCQPILNYTKYYVDKYGPVKGGIDGMIKEIYTNGPISGLIAITPMESYTGGIWQNCTTEPADHVIEITGWGEENGIPYWIFRNSMGTYWGENGWGRIIRGKNCMHIEEDCAWATPKV